MSRKIFNDFFEPLESHQSTPVLGKMYGCLTTTGSCPLVRLRSRLGVGIDVQQKLWENHKLLKNWFKKMIL
jgi:hypothetical protein